MSDNQGGAPAQGTDAKAWRRIRFRTFSDDPRPILFPPPGPYWISGTGIERLREYSILIAYLPGSEGHEIKDFWPEAELESWDGYDLQCRAEIAFTTRFPKPEWWSGEGAPTTTTDSRVLGSDAEIPDAVEAQLLDMLAMAIDVEWGEGAEVGEITMDGKAATLRITISEGESYLVRCEVAP